MRHLALLALIACNPATEPGTPTPTGVPTPTATPTPTPATPTVPPTSFPTPPPIDLRDPTVVEIKPDGTPVVHNDSQGHETEFFADRVSFTPPDDVAGFELTYVSASVGRDAAGTTVAQVAPRVENGRVIYDDAVMSTWYESSAAGVQQGFELHSAPTGSGDIRIQIPVEGDFELEHTSLDKISFKDAGGFRAFSYETLYVEDATGLELEADLWVGCEGTCIEIRFSDEGAVYPISVDPLTANAGAVFSGSSPNTGLIVAAGDGTLAFVTNFFGFFDGISFGYRNASGVITAVASPIANPGQYTVIKSVALGSSVGARHMLIGSNNGKVDIYSGSGTPLGAAYSAVAIDDGNTLGSCVGGLAFSGDVWVDGDRGSMVAAGNTSGGFRVNRYTVTGSPAVAGCTTLLTGAGSVTAVAVDNTSSSFYVTDGATVQEFSFAGGALGSQTASAIDLDAANGRVVVETASGFTAHRTTRLGVLPADFTGTGSHPALSGDGKGYATTAGVVQSYVINPTTHVYTPDITIGTTSPPTGAPYSTANSAFGTLLVTAKTATAPTNGAIYPYTVTSIPNANDLSADDLAITEIMRQSVASTDPEDGEWFEVLNTSGFLLDLQELRIGDGVNEVKLTSNVQLAPNARATIGNNISTPDNGGVVLNAGWSTLGSLDLGDTVGTLTLGNTGGIATLDTVTWSDATYSPTGTSGYTPTEGRSLVFKESATPATFYIDNDLRSNWCEAVTEYGPGVVKDRGTPNAVNITCLDNDGDQTQPVANGGTDCDDNRAASGLYQLEVEDNGFDDNCDGIDADLGIASLASNDFFFTEVLIDARDGNPGGDTITNANGQWFEIRDNRPGIDKVDLKGVTFTVPTGGTFTVDEFLVSAPGDLNVIGVNATTNGGVTLDHEISSLAAPFTSGTFSMDVGATNITSAVVPAYEAASAELGTTFDATSMMNVPVWCHARNHFGDEENFGTPGMANDSCIFTMFWDYEWDLAAGGSLPVVGVSGTFTPDVPVSPGAAVSTGTFTTSNSGLGTYSSTTSMAAGHTFEFTYGDFRGPQTGPTYDGVRSHQEPCFLLANDTISNFPMGSVVNGGDWGQTNTGFDSTTGCVSGL